MNSTEKLIQEKKEYIKSFEYLCKEYPHSEEYRNTVLRLKQEVADLVEGLYKVKDK